MNFCEKCSIEYEPGDTCMCAIFRGWMEDGRTDLVPIRWKLEYWDGYPNAPEYCDHHEFDESMDGSRRCKLCGGGQASSLDDMRLSTMTVQNLVDYLLNNDLEIQVVHRDINTIADAIAADFPDEVVPWDMIEGAIEAANEDPLIVQYYSRFKP